MLTATPWGRARQSLRGLRECSSPATGRPTTTRQRRFQGLLPVALNATGGAQAAGARRRGAEHDFAHCGAARSSGRAKPRRSSRARIGLDPRTRPRLVETDTGEWTDRPSSEVARRGPEGFAAFTRADPDFAFPAGESFRHQTARVWQRSRTPPRPAPGARRHATRMAIRLALIHLGRDGVPLRGASPAPAARKLLRRG